MLRSFLYALSEISTRFANGPPTPAFALAPLGLDIPTVVGRLLPDFRIDFGVPKSKTGKQKKQTRKFDYMRLLKSKTNTILCQTCGELHQVHTICGTCYEKVREETNSIKIKMMEQYNPYKQDYPDKEVLLKYTDDPDRGVVDGKRVIEMDKQRPRWFSDKLLVKK